MVVVPITGPVVELVVTVAVPTFVRVDVPAAGVLPPAVKTGRSADAYNEEHLAKARRYMILHGLGMKPAAIKVLMAFDEAIPIYQSAGVELRVDTSIDPEIGRAHV